MTYYVQKTTIGLLQVNELVSINWFLLSKGTVPLNVKSRCKSTIQQMYILYQNKQCPKLQLINSICDNKSIKFIDFQNLQSANSDFYCSN